MQKLINVMINGVVEHRLMGEGFDDDVMMMMMMICSGKTSRFDEFMIE